MMASRVRFSWCRLFVFSATFLLLIEGSLRVAGVLDFPLFEVDPEIGYFPRPNQSGNFLRRNDWAFNERGMGAGAFKPGAETDWLLLGDSIVYGGNHYRQHEKLGPNLEQKLGATHRVWPVGAGSWSVLNEMTCLERNSDILPDIDGLIWVLNSGDFQERSQWRSSITHPRQHPHSAVYHLFEKYVWATLIEPRLMVQFPSHFPGPPISSEPPDRWMQSFLKNLRDIRIKFPSMKSFVVLYPSQWELAYPDPEPFTLLQKALEEGSREIGCRLIVVRSDPRWNPSHYRDYIHPTSEGNRVLAEIVGEELVK